ncbi:MAG: MarP family serine protease [Acidimicrobiales bacterium]
MYGAILGLNLIDVALLALMIFSIVRGVQLGAAIQLGSYGGFWVGLLLGALIAPPIGRLVSAGVVRTVLSLVVVFGMASLLAGVGRYLGSSASQSLHRFRLGSIDASIGGVISIVATALGIWVFASVAVNSPFVSLSSEVATSKVVRFIDNVLPPAPSVFAKLDQLISSAGFPSVFATLPPTLAGPVTVPSQAEAMAIASKAVQSTVKIEGVGCGNILEGSGFVVAPGIVVTNAHVVAGISNPVVIDQSGDHAAHAIWFNPKFDLAVLDAPGVNDPALHVSTVQQSRGTKGALIGYPEGGPLTVDPAGVMAAFEARGRDIYNQGLTVRLVYQIQAVVRPGNSGGPLLDKAGDVIGVVFSRSTTNPDVGYALASPAVATQVANAEKADQTTSTGACAS